MTRYSRLNQGGCCAAAGEFGEEARDCQAAFNFLRQNAKTFS